MMGRSAGFSKFTIRVPEEVKVWLAEQVSMNASTFGSEIIRCCRQRMERTVETRTLSRSGSTDV
jgi:hypothetical protein